MACAPKVSLKGSRCQGRRTDDRTFPFFIDPVRGHKGLGAPQASADSRKYSVKGKHGTILEEDSFLRPLTFRLESEHSGRTVTISTA